MGSVSLATGMSPERGAGWYAGLALILGGVAAAASLRL